MAAKGGRIDFMFLRPPPYPAAGSATENEENWAGVGSRPKFYYVDPPLKGVGKSLIGR